MYICAVVFLLLKVPVILTSTETTYDFIIVGAGSTGAVIATRLSEISKWKVLLLEAGGYPHPMSEIPGLAGLLQFTDNNWNYTYEPQENSCLGMVDKRCTCPRGKTLGGTSVINYAVYSRGHPLDYDRWAELGNPGWSYEEVLPYFKKSECTYVEGADLPYRGTDGPVTTNISYFNDFGETFIKAGVELGYSYNPDYNSANVLGFSKTQSNTKFGRRQSTYNSFLQPASERKNLYIQPKTIASRILINELRKAYGVEYIQNGTKHLAYASKEIIVSAGAINSPQLLILSGIGPKDDLDTLKIPLVQHLPVGKVLKDHLMYCGLIVTMNVSVQFDGQAALKEFQEYGTGPLSGPMGIPAVAFLNSYGDPKSEPDIEIMQVPATLLSFNRTFARLMSVEDNLLTKYTKSLDNTNQFTMSVILLHPKSSGFIKINSTDPLQPPLIFGNFLSEQEDLKTMLKAIRVVQQLLETTAFQKINATLYNSPVPGCEDFVYDSDDYWLCASKRFASSTYHPTSTCKMGPKSDVEAVVDSELRVYGVDGLRVADASIIPYLPSGHTNAPCMMIGEKASDLIKGFWMAKDEL